MNKHTDSMRRSCSGYDVSCFFCINPLIPFLQTLVDFQYLEPSGKDQGINVRKKAQTLVSLINDKEKIREVRQKASQNRDKYAPSYFCHSEDSSAWITSLSLGICGPVKGKGSQTDTEFSSKFSL